MTASAIMTPLGIAALKAREGVRLTAYRDSVGVPTIGYGHTRGVRLGQRITQAQADAYFLEDLASHALPILSCIAVPVAAHERDALISIAFNIGVGGFRRSGFLRRLNAGDPVRGPPRRSWLGAGRPKSSRAASPNTTSSARPTPSPHPAPAAAMPAPSPCRGRRGARPRPSPTSPAASPASGTASAQPCAPELLSPNALHEEIAMSDTNRFRPLRLAAALLPAALVTACIPAQAAATDVVVQWGDAVVTGAQTLGTVLIPLAVTAAGTAAARMAGPLRFLVTTALVERLVRNASDYALNAVAGAVRGKSLTIPLGSAVIARAVQRALDQAPAWLIQAAGGPTGIAEKIFRGLTLEEAADAGNTLTPGLAAALKRRPGAA